MTIPHLGGTRSPSAGNPSADDEDKTGKNVDGTAAGSVAEAATTTPTRGHRHGLVFTALMTGVLGYTFAQSIVAPALPVIQGELHASVSTTAFVLTAFLLSASVATPVVGGLGDMFGKKGMLLVTLYALVAGLLMSALAGDSIALLIAGRAIQGVSAGAVPLAFTIVREEFPPRRVPLALGAVSAGFGIGGGAGVVVAGLVVDRLGHVWIFWTGLVVAVAGVAAAHLWVPASKEKHPARIDWPGAVLLGGWLAALLLALGQGDSWGWDSAPVVGLLSGAGALLLAWVGHELRTPVPLVDIRILGRRTVLTTNAVSLLTGFALFASFLLVPQLVQAPPQQAGYGFAASATTAGLFLLPQSLAVVVAGPLGGQLGFRFGSKLPLVLGTAVGAAAFLLLAVAHDQQWPIYLASGLLGLGLGLVFAAMPNLIVEAVEASRTGVSTGMNFVFRTVGSALGGQAVAGILASEQATTAPLPTESRFVVAFLTTAAALTVALVAALLVTARRPTPPTTASAASPEPGNVRAPVQTA